MSIALQRIVARLDLLSDAARRAQAEIRSCCLMPIGRPVGSKEWIAEGGSRRMRGRFSESRSLHDLTHRPLIRLAPKKERGRDPPSPARGEGNVEESVAASASFPLSPASPVPSPASLERGRDEDCGDIMTYINVI